MKFKKNIIKSSIAIMMLTSVISGCNTNTNINTIDDEDENNSNNISSNIKSDKVAPVTNSIFKILDPEEIISSGKMTSPWKNISVITRFCFRNIFMIDADTNEIKSDLAKSYSVSDDGLVYTVDFRDDLVWSDNMPITLDDIIFSIESFLLDTKNEIFFQTVFSFIEGTDDFYNGKSEHISGLEVNENILTISLSQPVTNFVHVLGQFAILPKHILEEDMYDIDNSDYWNNPVVSGMYKMALNLQGEQVVFTYNDLYVGEAPYIEKIIVRDDYDYNEVDYYTTNDIARILDFRAIPRMKEYDIETEFYRYIVYNIEKDEEIDPFLRDVRVRQAIAYAINNERLASEIYYNTCTPINTGLVVGSDRVYDYNPEKSIQLLDEAGYDFDRPLVLLHYYKDDTSIKFMEAMAENLQDVGFKTEIINGDIYENNDYDIALKGLSAFDITEWYAEYHSSHNLFTEVYGCGNPIFDPLIEKLSATTNDEDRLEVLEDLQKLAFANLYKYPIFKMDYKAYINSDSVEVPEDIVIGNPKYRYDNNFENWIIK